MFDYRALYEIQLQVSVDFLRVVQYRSLKDTTTTLLKGPKNDLKKEEEEEEKKKKELEAKSYHNFIICSLMRLKLAKVVHWNFWIIVNVETVVMNMNFRSILTRSLFGQTMH